jgi:hypothetical protein
MQELLNSPLVQDLKKGKLPVMEVDVSLSRTALAELAATLFLTAVAIMLAFQIIKKIS